MKTGIKFYNADEKFRPPDFARMVGHDGPACRVQVPGTSLCLKASDSGTVHAMNG